ncbi:uracil-DNA glycosylase [Myroides indicus]|uniref:Uracil-DNA glycosylase n=1 Tax=Myroides indicus TaxID=1323422 RepID=A0A4R7F5A0_9FLAO|nr:uracil-DNA glycosylase [Myroides indicus]TDS65313.1 uracil-DNA glycosylase [Myroides indicus]
MDVRIEPSWKKILHDEFEKPYFEQLVQFVKQEYAAQTIYPPASKIFAAFDNTPFDEVKVVIIGQDPYHGSNQANGLCFSVSDGIPLPPSLQNIYREIQQDLNITSPLSGNLERWAKQGVFLLNDVLTVRRATPASHKGKGWEIFTDAAIQKISDEKEHVVFLLWGSYAQKKGAIIDSSKHLVLKSGHPSPMSANRGYWFGNRHFSQTNAYLQNLGLTPIIW